MQSSVNTVDIMLVEDNPGDVRLVIETLKETGFPHRVHVAGNGIEALSMLRGSDATRRATRPGLILLDLNMPGMDGRQLLAELKSDPDLRRIPVVVFTSSRAAADVKRCHDLHANAYVCKPLDLDRMQELLRGFAGFWLDAAILPED